jgi:hypothetical protein
MGLVLRQAADAADQRGQILAVEVLHREEVEAVDETDGRRRGSQYDIRDAFVRFTNRRQHRLDRLQIKLEYGDDLLTPS